MNGRQNSGGMCMIFVCARILISGNSPKGLMLP